MKLFVKVSRVQAFQEAASEEENQAPYVMDSYLFEVYLQQPDSMMLVGRLYFSPEQMELVNPDTVIAELLEEPENVRS